MLRGIDFCAGSGIGSWVFREIGLCRTVLYVECEPYCQRVIRARIEDGLLDDAPIWPDARTLDGREWRGKADFIFGGIPCQPWSVAGKQRGTADERDLWPDFIRVVREVGPQVVLLENVRGLLAGDGGRGFGRILGDLADSGYDAEWSVLSAEAVGAPHRRERVWVVAYPRQFDGIRGGAISVTDCERKASGNPYRPSGARIGSYLRSDPRVLWPTPKSEPSGPDFARAGREGSGGDDLATAVARESWLTPSARDHKSGKASEETLARNARPLNEVVVQRETFPTPQVGVGPNSHDQISGDFRRAMKERGVEGGSLNPGFVEWLMGWPRGWSALEPLAEPAFDEDPWRDGEWRGVPRVAKGVADRVGRLRMLGNGWVPQCAAVIGARIMRAISAG